MATKGALASIGARSAEGDFSEHPRAEDFSIAVAVEETTANLNAQIISAESILKRLLE